MATRKRNVPSKAQDQAVEIEKVLNPSDKPERFQLGEVGYTGLSLFDGITNDELYRELSWPNSIKTYKQMSYHSSVNSCFSLYDNIISKVTWRVVPPEEATEEEKLQSKFINECLEDMETPLRQVIKDALSSNIYGFAIQEKVYRRRLKSKGSMFDDGKIGIKKIALRNQETMEKFIFTEDGNEVIGVKQNLSAVAGNRYGVNKNEVVLPRHKYIHVTTGRNREDPFGKSPLRDVYLAWRYLTVIEELEASGTAKDLSGMPVLRIPAQYMAADASPEQKAIYEGFKNIVRNVQMNSQSGIVLPSDVNPETRAALFNFELLSAQGNGKSFDTEKIKQYYQNQIYVGLSADLLILGNNGVGSFALGQLKSSLTGSAIESMLDNIVESFNRDLIRQLYELNGWDVSRACKLDYNDLHSADLETLSKYWQRVASVGLVEKDRAVLNSIRASAGIDILPEDMEPQQDLITPATSRAGDGMAKGSGNGTSDSVASTDTSSMNADNTA